jgi:hypothetical protein
MFSLSIFSLYSRFDLDTLSLCVFLSNVTMIFSANEPTPAELALAAGRAYVILPKK